MSGADIAVLAGIIAGVAGLLALEHFAVNGKLARPLAYAAGTATLFAGVVVWLVYAAVGWRVIVGVAVVMSLPGVVTFGLHWRRDKQEMARQEELREQQLHTMQVMESRKRVAAKLADTSPRFARGWDRLMTCYDTLNANTGFSMHHAMKYVEANERLADEIREILTDLLGMED